MLHHEHLADAFKRIKCLMVCECKVLVYCVHNFVDCSVKTGNSGTLKNCIFEREQV